MQHARTLAVSLMAALLALSAGCSTVKKTERANLVPFAEQTVSSLGVKPVYFRDNVHLRRHFDPSAPEVIELRTALRDADRFQQDVVDYSVDLLAISESKTSEPEKTEQVAGLFDAQASSGFIGAAGIERTAVDEALAQVRAQEKLLPALRAVQPLIDESAHYFGDRIPAIEEGPLRAVRDSLRQRIDTYYATLLEYEAAAGTRRDELLEGLLLTLRYRRGDKSALPELRQNQIILKRGLKVPANASEAQVARIEAYLMSELQKASQTSEYLAQDFDSYVQAHVELDRAYTELRAELDFVRLQFLAWARAHQAMANGVTEAAKVMKLTRLAPWPTR